LRRCKRSARRRVDSSIETLATPDGLPPLEYSLDNHCLGNYNVSTVKNDTAIHKPIYDAKSYDPQRGIGSLFGKVKSAMGAAFDAELAPLDITAAQYVILMSLAHGEVSSASDLCKGISYDPGAMTRMLDRLERRGLVRRLPKPDDRRTFALELTDEGRDVVPKLRAAGMKVLNRMLEGFSANEAQQLEGYLLRMLNNA
jgi:DNA-binding MarR family transcriptional regulator